jgi:hypothetical protein
MAENINALILPIGADPSQFNQSLNSVKAAFKDLSAVIAATPFNLVTDKQKEQLSGLERTFKTLGGELKNFGKEVEFPANSIAGITKKIDELNKRKISLDATKSAAEIASITQQVEKLIEKKNGINSLGKTLVQAFVAPENSIAGLDKRISDLNKKKINLDATKSAAQIARLTQEIEKLILKRNNIEGLGQSVSKIGAFGEAGFNKLQDSSRGARTALTSLSLVAQDLPFGFIAIQNNLPSLIQTFGELQRSTGGTGAALRQLGSALLGPSGIFLAFSAVTSIITIAVQKYGSLEAALGAIINKQSRYREEILKVNKSYENFNKEKRDSLEISSQESASIQGSISKVKSLLSIVTDLTKSYNERNSALNDLKSIDKERFGNLDIEKIKIDSLTKSVDDYISSIKEAAISKGFESAIGDASVQLAKAIGLQSKLQSELDDAKRKPVKFVGKEDRVDTSEIDIASDALKKQNKVINDLKNIISLYNVELDKSIKAQNIIQAPIDAANKEFDEQQKILKNSSKGLKEIDNRLKALNKFNQLKIELPQFDDDKAIDRKISSLQKYGNIVLDTTNYDFERADALKEIIEIDKEYFKNLDLTKTKLESIQGTIQNYIGYLYNVREIQKELAKPIDIKGVSDKIDTKIFIDTAKLRSDVPAIIDLLFPDERFDKISESWKKINKETAPELQKFKNQIRDALINKELTSGVKTNYEDIEKEVINGIQNLQNALETLEINEGVIDILNKGLDTENIYEKAIKDLLNFEAYQKAAADRIAKNFRFLQNPLEDLFGSVLEDGIANWQAFGDAVVSEIKKIAAALLAKTFITALGNLLAPGLGSLLGGAFEGISTDGLGNWLDIFDPQKSKVNFAGVQGGGMQMAGAVNLTLRGSDLVGSINRTNSTINRVG